MQSDCIRKATKACFNTCCVINPLALPPPTPASSTATSAADSRRSFVSAILSSIQPNTNFTNHESLPSLPQLISSLKNAVPNYLNTVLADVIRDQEYAHLSLSNRVFLDYIGHGLFSLPQKETDFEVCYTSANQESGFQKSIRERITRYMNVKTEDYSSVFTADESSAFKIIAESYPFYSHPNLLTVYDHENDAVEAMIARGRGRGARPHTASFSWPNLGINSRKLRKIVVKGRRRNRGIFVFPLQSRTSGARYPYQWMNLARENGWHVLLDASALGAKDMETLGLSLFQPDFIICSFFKIFGENPSGFCCLFIKKSCLSDLSQSATSIGIVRINPPSDKSAIDESQELQQSKCPAEQNEASCSEIIEVDDSRIECRAVTKSAIVEFGQDASCSEIIEVDEPRIECRAQFERNEAEIVECRAEFEDKEAEIVEFRAEIEDKEADKAECRAEIEDKEAEIVEFRARIEDKEAEIVEFQAEFEDKDAEIVECRAEFKDKEAEIVECRALDHADKLGLILIGSRVRYLVNWLVNALLSLEHPHSGNGLPLVTIYGPRIKLDRGPAIAFNVYDWKGERVDPILVQKLADRNNISLSLGFLKNICFSQDFEEKKCQVLENRGPKSKKRSKGDCGIRVVSVSLVMLSNFEDIYRVWAFVSRFLDADFVEKERWRYTALNQTTVEV